MKDFAGKIAVITGGGTGMGRALAQALVEAGCDVALCDISVDSMNETTALCRDIAPQGIRVTSFRCDVSQADQMDAFAAHVSEVFDTRHINLLFNNAGIAGGGSFVLDDRGHWENTFNVCWGGVYNGARAFLPMLVASQEGHMVNTSSINGIWAGPNGSHTAYCAAKFAVRGFSEALITDLRLNAPHVKVSAVMPGHVGTSILLNSSQVDDVPDQAEANRSLMRMMGNDVNAMDDDAIRTALATFGAAFRDVAPTSAAEAAEIILTGVKDERWRILVGPDAHTLDELVREDPEAAYEPAFLERWAERRRGSE